VVALEGLQDLESLITLAQGTQITVRHLLLAIPAPGTSTGKLFQQVERQANSDYLLCCFPSVDSAKTTIRLGQIESLLKKYVKPEDTAMLFKDPSFSLKFNGQYAPMRKGRSQYSTIETPDGTSNYAKLAMSKLVSPPPKRLALDLDQSNDRVQEANKGNSIITPTLVTPQTSNLPARQPPQTKNLEDSIAQQHNRLSRLEECCSKLADTTQTLALQMSAMNENVNKKFQEMSTSISNLKLSPNRRSNKLQKNHNSTIDPDI